ncbi:MAG: hypothetical protein IJJ28_02990, partial [Lentisphaeria bacterium]|nr:hypothetical protein [Lentisphaeria bacterium]
MSRKAPTDPAERFRDLGIYLLAALLLLVSVRGSSLWIDEGQTLAVLGGSWSDLFRSLTRRGDAVSGMPLYFIVNYGFTRLTGLSEYGMRALNLLFGALYLLLAARLLKKLSLSTVFLLFFAANPV